jgi:tetratricopeptide (TPR) repeat protein
MFLEKRVYQGSSGRVYPLPFFDRISDTPVEKAWDSVTIENEFVSLTVLPQIGGRIHLGTDKTNGYDFFYRQDIIKPALVGLAGPWCSGGVEFNWPQHHRPSTFMPTEVFVEHDPEGSMTVWMSEHDPMCRMKGMHGVCLHPGRSVVELKVRLYNRTPYVQTFLWWSNIAIRVHEAYRSFFPPDVHTVADHAKRATSAYPLCQDHYYGVDYGNRGRHGVPADERPRHFVPRSSGGSGPEYAPNDLSWYANIPVPTSYMCLGTNEDFLGGYDGYANAGLIHVADHHIAPGKKQWTWGNQEFGYAWDRNLTNTGGPYIELMAGIYTDNQPDFSFMGPGETKTFSQFLYPYQSIGVAQFANIEAALSVVAEEDKVHIGVAVTRPHEKACVTAWASGKVLQVFTGSIAPDRPFKTEVSAKGPVLVTLQDETGLELARYENVAPVSSPVAPPATEPAMPEHVATSDELYLIGLHLDQYRHATRDAATYWREALRRDSGDVRCNNALGLWHFRRGEFEAALTHFDAAINRATHRNPNPYDGEPYYNRGLTLRFLGRDEDAEAAFAKSAWSAAWQASGYHAVAELACRKQNWPRALDQLDRAIRKDADNFRARDLKAIVLRKLGRSAEADAELREILRLDPLDFWARSLGGESIECDNSVLIDLTIDLMRAGLTAEALEMLGKANKAATDGTAPMIAYYEAWILARQGECDEEALKRASTAPIDYCFPARLEDIEVLEHAIRRNPDDASAHYYLGNLLYDRRRHREAIELWEKAAKLDPTNSIALRNLGIGAFNVFGKPARARAAYDAAVLAAPEDARLRYERDQLWKRIGISPEKRLKELRKRMDHVVQRDDLTIEFCTLLNSLGHHEEAQHLLEGRKFQPWEGGEGQALGVFVRTHLALGRLALNSGDPILARAHFERAQFPPETLGEARHLLANASDVWLALGDALSALGELPTAEKWWRRAADFKGDFQEMSVRKFSELTYFQAVAQQRLGCKEDARKTLLELEKYAKDLALAKAKIDYFATSLPTMLLFEDDLQRRQENTARFIQAQAAHGLGRHRSAEALLEEVLRIDPNHIGATDLLAQKSKRSASSKNPRTRRGEIQETK